MPKKKIKLAHLYPKLLNIYGDGGNILAIKKRCEWRGIEIIIDEITKSAVNWYNPMTYGKNPELDNSTKLWAAVDQIIKSKDGSELKSKLLHDLWANARNDLVKANTVEERAKIIKSAFEKLRDQDPRAYLASFHPDILKKAGALPKNKNKIKQQSL